jgi:alkylhydroperoxidase family enzyme
MHLDTPRLAPIDEQDWNDEQKEMLGKQAMRGNVPNVLKTLIHHEKLAKRWLVFAAHILSKSTMTPRDREIAILRTGWLAGSKYEWGQHVLIGQEAGLSMEEINEIKEGSTIGNWPDHERNILKACEELHEHVFLSDETWAGLSSSMTSQQIMDLIFTCGQYRMLAGALNSLGVPLDDDIKHLVD